MNKANPAISTPTLLSQIQTLKKRAANIEKKIKDLQATCPHKNYEVLRAGNDHNGWDVNVDITYYQVRKCKDCEDVSSVVTGVSRY